MTDTMLTQAKDEQRPGVNRLRLNLISMPRGFDPAVLFSLAGFINAVFAKNFDDIAIVPTFVLTPLTYLGGVFYSIELLSEPWQTLSRFNPILYMVNGFRFGILGVSDIHVFGAIAVIAGFVFGLFFFALGLLNRGVGIRA